MAGPGGQFIYAVFRSHLAAGFIALGSLFYGKPCHVTTLALSCSSSASETQAGLQTGVCNVHVWNPVEETNHSVFGALIGHTGVLGRSVASAEGQDVAMTSCAGLACKTFGKPRLRRSIHTYFVILWPARFWTLRSEPVHTIFKSGSPSQVNFSAMGSKQQGLGGHACL